MNKLANLNLGKICRICLSESQETHLILNEASAVNYNFNIREFLEKITNTKLSEVDELPDKVCDKCLQYLVEISKFLQLCISSDKIIQTYYNELKFPTIEVNVKEEPYLDERGDNGVISIDEFWEDFSSEESYSKLTPKNLSLKKKYGIKFRYYQQTLECGRKEYVCNLCPSRFQRSDDFKAHIVTHGKEPYVCSSCRKSYKVYRHLHLHLKNLERTKSNKPEKLYKHFRKGLKYYLQLQECGREAHVCNFCFERCVDSSEFVKHLRTHCEEPFVCNECKKQFGEYKDLVEHLKEHSILTGDDEEKDNKSISVKKVGNYYLKTLENGEEWYSCNLCEKLYKQFKYLKTHLSSHGDKPYWCIDCKKQFKTYHLLRLHCIAMHTISSTRYNCDLCDRSYKVKANLAIHKKTHRGERPHLCSICGKSFLTTTGLKSHSRTHSEERSFMCTYCGLKFKAKKSMMNHIRMHTGETPYKCSECPKKFTTSSKLKRHQVTHTGLKPYVCHICQKAFNRSSNLHTHIRSHSDLRPYICSICHKGFTQAHSLRTHMLIHDKEQSSSAIL